MGIFGFLSKAHLDQVVPENNNKLQIEIIDKQIDQRQKTIDRSQYQLDKMDELIITQSKESSWFSPDLNAVGGFMLDFYKNKKRWNENAKRQGFRSRDKFSFEKMKVRLDELLNNNVKQLPSKVSLNLPKLKKTGTPKLKKV